MFLGVTGNSGTGQTTVAAAFSALGASVCSLDATGHRLLERNSVRSALARGLYRPDLISLSGPELRRELSLYAIDRPDVMETVEAVLHPLMKRWAFLSRSLLRNREGVWVLEGALIFEMNLDGLLDSVVLVSDTEERSCKRLEKRDGIGRDIVSARWARQLPINRKKYLADHVIDNSGSLAELNEEAKRLYISLTG
jgi:dephospho-CoA kinase